MRIPRTQNEAAVPLGSLSAFRFIHAVDTLHLWKVSAKRPTSQDAIEKMHASLRSVLPPAAFLLRRWFSPFVIFCEPSCGRVCLQQWYLEEVPCLCEVVWRLAASLTDALCPPCSRRRLPRALEAMEYVHPGCCHD
ncbi:hypothetical protein SRHO_G00146020 [Serrasalmus rhombeus]